MSCWGEYPAELAHVTAVLPGGSFHGMRLMKRSNNNNTSNLYCAFLDTQDALHKA